MKTQQKSKSSVPNDHGIHKTNYASVREELSKHNWEEELVSTFEDDYNIFIDLLLSYIDKCMCGKDILSLGPWPTNIY